MNFYQKVKSGQANYNKYTKEKKDFYMNQEKLDYNFIVWNNFFGYYSFLTSYSVVTLKVVYKFPVYLNTINSLEKTDPYFQV